VIPLPSSWYRRSSVMALYDGSRSQCLTCRIFQSSYQGMELFDDVAPFIIEQLQQCLLGRAHFARGPTFPTSVLLSFVQSAPTALSAWSRIVRLAGLQFDSLTFHGLHMISRSLARWQTVRQSRMVGSIADAQETRESSIVTFVDGLRTFRPTSGSHPFGAQS